MVLPSDRDIAKLILSKSEAKGLIAFVGGV